MAPAPKATPTPTPAPEAEGVVVTIDTVYAAKRSFSALDSFGTRFEFQYRDDTLVRGNAEAFVRLDEWLEGSSTLPFGPGRKVRVEWKTSVDQKRRVATKITNAH